ncbi:MAG: DUF11 domain-containing protein [Anaerolineae bacterium]|nr:DUF11 domain-containing protein [Anaerolineae bacterium]
MLKKLMLVLLTASLLLVASFPTHAQDTTPTVESLLGFTTGVLGDEGEVYYSVILGSGPDALTDLTVTATLPEGATFVEVFWTPEAATFIGEDAGTVSWTLPELAADTIIGPFTVTVTFEEAEANIPTNIPAFVTHAEGTLELLAVEGILEPFETTGVLDIEEVGTGVELAKVGDTNIFVFAPPNAFDRPVSLRFELLPAGDPTNVPSEIEGYWWCTSVQITVEPAEAVSLLPIQIFLPNRRTLTPGMPLSDFAKRLDSEWQVFGLAGNMSLAPSDGFAKPNLQTPIPDATVAGNGNHSIIAILIGIAPINPTAQLLSRLIDGTSNTIVGGTGVLEQDRKRGTSSTSALRAEDGKSTLGIMVIALSHE